MESMDQLTVNNQSINSSMVEANLESHYRNQITAAILKRIGKEKDIKNVGIDVQESLESLSEEDNEENMENIINQKTKSIANVLANEGFGQLYSGTFFNPQMMHPYARWANLNNKLQKQQSQAHNDSINQSMSQGVVEFSLDETQNQFFNNQG